MALIPLIQVLLAASYIVAAPSSNADISSVAPTVVLDAGTFVGVGDISTHRFLGIPFAKPPYVPLYSTNRFSDVTYIMSIQNRRLSTTLAYS